MSGVMALTIAHVAISLVGIVSGFATVMSWMRNRRWERWTEAFLWTTIATSASGFLFPVDRFMPSHAFGIISLGLLATAVVARSGYHYSGRWRTAYVVTSLSAFYLNIFVLIVQSFLKIPVLKALAPTQTEAPFAVAQIVALVSFVIVGFVAVRRFRPAGAAAGLPAMRNATSQVTVA